MQCFRSVRKYQIKEADPQEEPQVSPYVGHQVGLRVNANLPLHRVAVNVRKTTILSFFKIKFNLHASSRTISFKKAADFPFLRLVAVTVYQKTAHGPYVRTVARP